MTPPPDSRRPPSEELSWEVLIGIEQQAVTSGGPLLGLCRTIRSLCEMRDELRAREVLMFIAATDEQGDDETLLGVVSRAFATLPELKRGIREAEAERDTARAQLSAYVTAAEGRPASELIAPSEVARIIEQRDYATKLAEAQYRPKLAEYEQAQRAYYDQVRGLKEQLAEQAAEIEQLKADHFMPGAWVCDKCDFGVYKRVLAMPAGEVFVDNAEVDERCPNDGQQMRRKTFKEVCAQQDKYIDTLRPPRAEIES